jgi:hypothetical protein
VVITATGEDESGIEGASSWGRSLSLKLASRNPHSLIILPRLADVPRRCSTSALTVLIIQCLATNSEESRVDIYLTRNSSE